MSILEPTSPPISRSHKLQTSNEYYLKIWCAGMAVFLGWAIWEYLNPGPFQSSLDAAVRPAIGIFFFGILAAASAYMGWQTRKEFAAMREGRYFAHWKYEDLELWKLLSGFEKGRRRTKVKAVFWIPFVAIGGGGTVLGIIGSFAKSDPMVGVKVGAWALSVGAAVGGIISGLTYLLTGVSARLLENGHREVIFTGNGFYIPGFFIPVMSYARSKRKIELTENRQQLFLCFTLKVPTRRGNDYHQNEMTVFYTIPVPSDRRDEAAQLVEYYTKEK